MTGSTRKSPAKEQRKEKTEMRVNRIAIVTATALLGILGGVILCAQGQDKDKYSLVSPDGVAFTDFKGYEDWSVVSRHQEEVLKVIVANPEMIKAYKSGSPGDGHFFPDGSRIVKLQWKPKKSTEAPFVVDVPDVFKQAFVMEKDSKRFPKTAAGDTRCSTMTPHPASSPPIPRLMPTAETHVIWL